MPDDEPDVAERVEEATAARLLEVARVVLGHVPDAGWGPRTQASEALSELARELARTRRADLAWLLLAALAGAYPSAAEVRTLQRSAALQGERELTLSLLDAGVALARRFRSALRPLRVVTGTLVDVDSCARYDFHNGIQRVAREVARVWAVERDVELAGWTWGGGGLRALTPAETERAARWTGPVEQTEEEAAAEDRARDLTPLLVPWHATVVLLEVPAPDPRCSRLAALAELSGSRVVGIGYDAIPVVSADLRPLGEPNGFAEYLTVVKHTRRMAGISSSAAQEFAGYAAAMAAQGLPGPRVSEVALPTTVPPAPPGWTRPRRERPLVLSVGRLEPHKNHGALLHAAERLWREGAQFDLCLVGRPGWDVSRVQGQLDRIRAAGRPLDWRTGVDDDELWTLLRSASCTAFVSLHEGFGLPVAESLACGTPVLTTRYGSQGEIAALGGCVTVDPRDDDDVLAGLRRLVTDADLRARLRAEAAAIPARTWADYADELWADLVEETA
ncbi:glycosyltransferase [Cellulomonas marina]|nr:glycosyltransferase [Cellulomonas marina]GIG29926.1 hypothetical protein Cma02nite_25260 [Cellulomonas marina]